MAWWRGSSADRIVATGFLADTLLSLALNNPDDWARIQLASFVIDAALLAALLAVTVRRPAIDRVTLAALQAALVAVHVARALPSFDRGGGYAVATAALTYVQALLLLIAMGVRAARRRRRSASS